jgi:hypothetical protein
MNINSLKKQLVESPVTYHFTLHSRVRDHTTLRGASHYGRRSRGRRFPPIKLQETKSSIDPSHYGQSPKAVAFEKDYFLKEATDSRRKFVSDMNGNPNYGREFGHSIPRPLDLDGHSVKWP